ncbi:type I restriction enzyme S subunit [Neolewinella xylanilytica]|uniref:Type I restriction enzyme S subunit n=1 Tax=Neolewinella xylanilytica TaxID=1514080 RepID=A0A2S6IA42_9BACT|nr:restriction endonuclease subunit S [Neolewinella xylanilytica]PPK88358.1 type I restriction enzyme S subunit [Neolewinella xylanilytica]
MKQDLVPSLRFKRFSGKWITEKLGKATIKVGSGSTPKGGSSVYVNSGVIFIRSQNVNNDCLDTGDVAFITEATHEAMRGSTVKPGDILLNITGASLGRSCVVPQYFKEGNVNQHVCIIRLRSNYSNEFYQAYLSSFNGQKKLFRNQAGSGREGLNFQGVRSLKVAVPTLPEQQKIAAFLTAVDGRLRALRRKRELLEAYKRGVMQRVFGGDAKKDGNNSESSIPLRTVKFGKVFERVKRKNKDNNQNILTISAQQGLVNQQDYFNKSVAANNVTGYYLLKRGEFAYNKSYSKGYPYGAIKRLNEYDQGVLSTLYICFKIADDQVLPEFMEQYFEAGGLNHEISKIAQEGARNHGLLNVSVVEFFKDINLYLPPFQEQGRIATFLRSLDNRIALVERQLAGGEAFKRGLLQQMFV